jgi:hypothetical protein
MRASKQEKRPGSPPAAGSPVLASLQPVIRKSRHVRTDARQVAAVAEWMACEELPFPEFVLPFGVGAKPDEAMDFILVSTTLNFAFTDFTTGVKFQAEYGGRRWSDSEALFACLKRALDTGIPFLDGAYLRQVSRRDLEKIFRGNIELPMLEERAAILRHVGGTLCENYGGHFRRLVRAAGRCAFDGGHGLVERLAAEFPRFADTSRYRGRTVQFHKLAQLGVWMLHATLGRGGAFRLEDPERLTAFADYIVPVALRVMGILKYSPQLERAIRTGTLLARDSVEEIEIRAHTIHAVDLLTREVNRRRPHDRPVIAAQIDARLWTHFHTTHWPHHLTRTIMY